MTNSILHLVALAAALSLDTFTAAIALGAQKIRLPLLSLLTLSLTCSASMWLAVVLGDLAGEWITPRVASIVGCAVLVCMGAVRLFDSMVKRKLQRLLDGQGMVLRYQNLKIFLQVCVDSTQADFNCSKSLSVPEAASLAAALSMDGLAAGFGAGMLNISSAVLFLLAVGCHLLAATVGRFAGERLARKSKGDLSWIAGAVLILLGLSRLL